MNSRSHLATRFGIRSYQPVKYAVDLSLWTLAAVGAFLLRLDKEYLLYAQEIIVYTIISIIVKAILIRVFFLHHQSWHKVGVRDLFTLVRATAVGTLTLLAISFIINPLPIITHGIPRSVPILENASALLLMGGVRMALRLWNEQTLQRKTSQPARRILVVGAGEVGTMITREMLRRPDSGMTPIGFVDNDLGKRNTRYMGVPVLGTIDRLPYVVRRHKVEEVLIAMPSAPGEVIRHVVELARESNVKYRSMPGYFDILSGKVSISQIREVDVEDLLRRAPIRLDMQEIAAYLENRVVLVTGAGGSIGFEIVRQAMHFHPHTLILLDRDENGLYLAERALSQWENDVSFETILADIQSEDKLRWVFEKYRPHVVFHAAAHKHVPVMEYNPEEAVLNNIQGTKTLLDLAQSFDVARFVNISTDKAVNPTSVMGASKRIVEYLVSNAAQRAGEGQAFVSVRFGNVLGSRGSVVPIFKEQIRKGGPVGVTHPDITRYFMSIPEATQLVLQAASLGDNGAVYLLDMGEPVKIVDLACELIRLSGFQPHTDIAIEYIGLRPGEKMYEALSTPDEDILSTPYKKILRLRYSKGIDGQFDRQLADLIAAARQCDRQRIFEMIKEMLPSYSPRYSFPGAESH